METIYEGHQYDSSPDAVKSYSIGWNVMKSYFVELLVISIIYTIISGPSGIMQWKTDSFEWYMAPLIFFALIYGIFVGGPITYGASWAFLKAVRGERVEIKDVFSVFQRNYWNAVVANLVVAVIVGIGIIMLIVPGIIFACRLAFVPYLVVDRKMDVMEALRVSWDMTRGYGWQIFFMGFLAIWIGIGGFILLFVGVFISIMWISSAFAAMYHSVEKLNGVPEITYRGG
jgi:hypothetical protein